MHLKPDARRPLPEFTQPELIQDGRAIRNQRTRDRVDHVKLFFNPNGEHALALIDSESVILGSPYFDQVTLLPVGVIDLKQAGSIMRRMAGDPLRALAEQECSVQLDPYARKIVEHARLRGIDAQVLDARDGYLSLTSGSRKVLTRCSLSELTSAVAASWCQDKRMTRKLLAAAGLRVPRGRVATFDAADVAFLQEVGEVVVKPVNSEQGWGVTVGVRDRDSLERARLLAQRYCHSVLLEECHEGQDLRVIVIAHRVVAAAVRHPPTVVGNGRDTIATLIARRSAAREAKTGGESTIPVDDHLRDTVTQAGYRLDDILDKGVALAVRRNANLHTGGTLEDVEVLHPQLARVAELASKALAIPVVGIDLLVPSPQSAEYVIIEANERPGLDNHQPQPTHECFLDLLFPETRLPAVPG